MLNLVFTCWVHFNMSKISSENPILDKILTIRWEKVMLDRDLAELYWVETKRLNEVVKRNLSRFPLDFMFHLTSDEFENLRSQFATSSWWWQRYAPYAFTEHGILMLSSVLRSQKAVQVNISIIRVFNHMRKVFSSNQVLMQAIENIERRVIENSTQIQELRFELRKVLDADIDEERMIGFRFE